MSFTPLSGGLSTALSGAIEPTKFIDLSDLRSEDLSSRRIHGPERKPKSIGHIIIIVIITAIIFVTVVALYDLLRNSLNTYFANKALMDPNSHNTPEDIERTQIANLNELWSSIVFAAICLVLAVILILVLLHFLNQL